MRRNLLLLLFLPLLSFIITGCAEFYDYAKNGVPVNYALSYESGTPELRLFIVGPDAWSSYVLSYPVAPSGMAVNGNNKIIYWDATNTYVSDNGISSWNYFAGTPNEVPVGLKEDFFYLNSTDFDAFDFDSGTWLTRHSFPGSDTPINQLIQGHGYEGYVCVNGTSNVPPTLDIYRIYKDGTELISSNSISTVPGYITDGFRYGDIFYICSNSNTLDTVLRVSGGVATSLNPTVSAGNSVSDVAVTESGGVYFIADMGGGTYVLRRITAVDTITTIFSMGTTGTFQLAPLGKNLLISGYSADTGYNGLYIFDTGKSSITEVLTDVDVAVMYSVH